MGFLKKIKYFFDNLLSSRKDNLENIPLSQRGNLSEENTVMIGMIVACWRSVKSNKGSPPSADHISKFVRLYLEQQKKIGAVDFNEKDWLAVQLIVHSVNSSKVERFRIEKFWTYDRFLILEKDIGYRD